MSGYVARKRGRGENRAAAISIVIAKAAAPHIAQEIPDVANDYRQGMEYAAIVELHGLVGRYGITSANVAMRALYFALESMFPPAEFRSLRDMHATNRGRAFAARALKKRGVVPFSDAEVLRLLELYDGKRAYREIADTLNSEYHGGKPVRTAERLPPYRYGLLRGKFRSGITGNNGTAPGPSSEAAPNPPAPAASA